MKAAKMTEIENVEKQISDLKNGIDDMGHIRRDTERALKNAKQTQQMLVRQNRPAQDQKDTLLTIRNYTIDLEACNASIANSHQLMEELMQRKVKP